jgi:hypothetical protein
MNKGMMMVMMMMMTPIVTIITVIVTIYIDFPVTGLLLSCPIIFLMFKLSKLLCI